ncbi:MAG: RusA family crossover junction endodeoxyribonuclease [Methanobrevibacter sp.]|nr:RusA family crossover junction endodeoxyribonuclease [Methanobrevibacter sp.]
MKWEDQNRVEWFIRSQLRGVRIKKPVIMVYTWYEPNRKRDLDNISSYGRKVIQDALVHCGVIHNDGWKQILGFYDRFYVDRKEPRIEVVILEDE